MSPGARLPSHRHLHLDGLVGVIVGQFKVRELERINVRLGRVDAQLLQRGEGWVGWAGQGMAAGRVGSAAGRAGSAAGRAGSAAERVGRNAQGRRARVWASEGCPSPPCLQLRTHPELRTALEPRPPATPRSLPPCSPPLPPVTAQRTQTHTPLAPAASRTGKCRGAFFSCSLRGSTWLAYTWASPSTCTKSPGLRPQACTGGGAQGRMEGCGG